MKRKNIFGISLSIVIVMLLISITPVIAQTETLVIWAPSDLTPDLEALGEKFEADFGIALDVQEVAFGDIAGDLLNFGPVGEGPDVLVTENSRLGQLVDNGALLPIDLTGMEELFEPSALNIFTYQNQLWAVPYAWENVAFVYNTDLVPEAPATWQEVREISEQLMESGQSQYGFMMYSGDPYHSFPIISAFDGYIFAVNEDGTYDVGDIGLNSEGGLAAAQWISDMYNDGLMVLGVDGDVMMELWTSGDVAMFITGPWNSQRLIDSDVSYQLGAIPGAEGAREHGRPFSGGFAFAISAFSDKPLLAESFILDFMASKEAMEAIVLADEGTALTRFPAFVEVDYSNDANIAGFIAAGSEAIPMPQIPEMGAVWTAWGNALTLIGQGDDPVATFNTATDQIAEAINLSQQEGRVAGLPGNYQAAVGCATDWDPACEVTLMEAQGEGIFTLTLTIPAGDWEYKVAMDGGWDESYPEGMNNITLSLSEETEVTFTYDDNTHTVSDSVNGN